GYRQLGERIDACGETGSGQVEYLSHGLSGNHSEQTRRAKTFRQAVRCRRGEGCTRGLGSEGDAEMTSLDYCRRQRLLLKRKLPGSATSAGSRKGTDDAQDYSNTLAAASGPMGTWPIAARL